MEPICQPEQKDKLWFTGDKLVLVIPGPKDRHKIAKETCSDGKHIDPFLGQAFSVHIESLVVTMMLTMMLWYSMQWGDYDVEDYLKNNNHHGSPGAWDALAHSDHDKHQPRVPVDDRHDWSWWWQCWWISSTSLSQGPSHPPSGQFFQPKVMSM